MVVISSRKVRFPILVACVLCSFLQVYSQMPTKLDTISQTTVEPYNKICYLHIYRKRFPKKDSWFMSTGFFITPNIILTAAHNVHSEWGTKVSKIEVVPAKYYDDQPFGMITINGKDGCRRAIKTHPDYKFTDKMNKRIKYDFGIIIIPNEQLTANHRLDNKQVFFLDSSYILNQNDTVNVAGYPADSQYGFHGDFMTFQKDLCRGVNGKIFNHRLDTYTGNSGSPIWINLHDKRVIIGIHTFGGSGTRLDTENLRIIFQWLNQSSGN